MAYKRTVWTNDSPPYVNAQNLNNIEDGIDVAHDIGEAAQAFAEQEQTDRIADVNAEETARQSADNTLAGNITAEVQARQNADTTLAGEIDAHEAKRDNPHGVTAAQAGAVAKAGDTMTGRLTLSADPTSALHPVTLQYLQGILEGRDPKENVRAATTANITLSGLLTVDGVALAAGDRVLVKNQTTANQNGLYAVAAGAWTRTLDANTAQKISGMYVYVSEGATQAETGWSLYTDVAITLGTTALTFGQTYGPGSVQAGDGLTRTLNALSVNPAVYPKGSVGTPTDGQVWTYDTASGGWIPKTPAAGGGSSSVTGTRRTIQNAVTGVAGGAVDSVVNFDLSTFDSGSFWNTSQKAFVVPAGVAGKYHLLSTVVFEQTDTNGNFRNAGMRRLRFYLNNSMVFNKIAPPSPQANTGSVVDGGDYLALAAGDVIQIRAAHTDTGTININSASSASLIRIGA